ncbi:unnamed protein product [Hyaloperonospora brassicae]|nr:unnamed protein product [Hyaloperonospora brassicae]
MAEQTSTACASTKGPPDDDPFEKAKKKVQEVSNIAIAQLGALVPDEWDHLKKRVNEVSASGKAGQVSWGCCTGLCAGFALKKASKVGAVAIGALLGLLYGACSLGYVNVDAEKLGRDFRRYLDIHQGGGVDTKDVDAMYKSVMKVLHSNLPAGSSFAVGFVLGFRSG